MLQITPQMRILVCVEPVDFRNGIDGLAQSCKAALGEDPFRGTVFVFRNRRGTPVSARGWPQAGRRRFFCEASAWQANSESPDMRYSLRTLIVLMLILPPLVGWGWREYAAYREWRSMLAVKPVELLDIREVSDEEFAAWMSRISALSTEENQLDSESRDCF